MDFDDGNFQAEARRVKHFWRRHRRAAVSMMSETLVVSGTDVGTMEIQFLLRLGSVCS